MAYLDHVPLLQSIVLQRAVLVVERRYEFILLTRSKHPHDLVLRRDTCDRDEFVLELSGIPGRTSD